MNTAIALTCIISNFADCGAWRNKSLYGKVAGSDASKIWHLARSLDIQGSGKAEINLSDTAEFFERKQSTILRWLKAGLKLGFLRSFTYLPNSSLVQVYYTGVVKLAKKLGITDLGAIVTAPLSALKNLKQSASIAEALQLQKRSQYKAERKKGLGEKIDISKLFGRSSEHGTGAIARTFRYIYLTNESNVYGGSQHRVAWESYRHKSTVQRRLSNLSPLNKRQIAQSKPEYLRDFIYLNHCQVSTGKLFRHPDFPRLIFKAGCCLYNFPLWEARKYRYLRAKVKGRYKCLKKPSD